MHSFSFFSVSPSGLNEETAPQKRLVLSVWSYKPFCVGATPTPCFVIGACELFFPHGHPCSLLTLLNLHHPSDNLKPFYSDAQDISRTINIQMHSPAATSWYLHVIDLLLRKRCVHPKQEKSEVSDSSAYLSLRPSPSLSVLLSFPLRD